MESLHDDDEEGTERLRCRGRTQTTTITMQQPVKKREAADKDRFPCEPAHIFEYPPTPLLAHALTGV